VEEAKIRAEELMQLARDEVPIAGQLGILVEAVEPGSATAKDSLPRGFRAPRRHHRRPGDDGARGLREVGRGAEPGGPVHLAVNSSLNINFLRRPLPVDLPARGSILKLGRRLAVGEVSVHCGPRERLVTHVTCTYALPGPHTGPAGVCTPVVLFAATQQFIS
jgi:acyl-coenzyme A thioesterase PaaI-like protein